MNVLLKALTSWRTCIEILILWFVIYRILIFIKGTKSLYLLRGIFVLVLAFGLFNFFELYVLTRILAYFFAFFLILMVIIFQPELREVLTRLGKRHIFYVTPKKEEIENALREVSGAVGALARKKIGALIAIEREIGLKNYIESGVVLNADLSSELIQNIFQPLAPLHDGGVIIEGGRVVAASCLFPLNQDPTLAKALGTRHRAAIGLSEHSDALVIVVSEENGTIALAINGQLTQELNTNDLLTILRGQLTRF